MRKLLATLVIAVAAMCSTTAFAATQGWEEVTSPAPAITQTMEMDSEVEITVRDNYIYVWCDKTINIKIFSILGQQISHETLKPGLHRIKMASRGIYILRTGTTTRRITI